MHRRRLRHQIAVWLFVACAPGLASADWPVGPITLVLGAPEGSELDKVARVLAPALERRLGTPIALDYRDGAQGSTASAYVAAARPDGYTMALLSDPAVSAANLATVENIGRLALIAPKGVSLEILERVGSAVREVLQHSIIREKLTGVNRRSNVTRYRHPILTHLEHGQSAAQARRCARHGHWIGGASPSRGELVATVSRRQLHAAWSVVRRAMLAPRGRVGKKPEANRSTERE